MRSPALAFGYLCSVFKEHSGVRHTTQEGSEVPIVLLGVSILGSGNQRPLSPEGPDRTSPPCGNLPQGSVSV